jgi:hypothetical protein
LVIVAALAAGGLSLAQGDMQANPTPIMPSDTPKAATRVVPAAVPSPDTMPGGGLYRLGNGYLSCPDNLQLMDGHPNLRSCVYVKDLH